MEVDTCSGAPATTTVNPQSSTDMVELWKMSTWEAVSVQKFGMQMWIEAWYWNFCKQCVTVSMMRAKESAEGKYPVHSENWENFPEIRILATCPPTRQNLKRLCRMNFHVFLERRNAAASMVVGVQIKDAMCATEHKPWRNATCFHGSGMWNPHDHQGLFGPGKGVGALTHFQAPSTWHDVVDMMVLQTQVLWNTSWWLAAPLKYAWLKSLKP